jgi:hypothetical protein
MAKKVKTAWQPSITSRLRLTLLLFDDPGAEGRAIKASKSPSIEDGAT